MVYIRSQKTCPTYRESVDPPAVEKTPVSSPKGKTVLTSTSILATSGGALLTESPFCKNFQGFHSQEKALKEKEIPQKTPVSSPKGKTVLPSTSILATSGGGALSTESPFCKNFRGFHSQEKALKEKEIPQMKTMGDDNLPSLFAIETIFSSNGKEYVCT